MANPYIGEIKMVGFSFAASGWAFASGQTIAISQNNALFALLGTTYGGDGVQTFQLPDLRSRMPMHMGQGFGLSARTIGQIGGAESATFPSAQVPSSPVAPIQALASRSAVVSSLSPFLTVNFIIALFGVFPSQN
jgi:microcystin-dependent protein